MNRMFILPSGKLVTVFVHEGERHYQLPTRGSAEWVTLDAADVEALYADSIAHDGGRAPAANHKCGCPIGGCCLACCCGESHP